ncbi:MAG: hypothetical protein Q4D04_08925 [Clostridia bacterium]|nr:hypothetical protein [Clostridia bacterium]
MSNRSWKFCPFAGLKPCGENDCAMWDVGRQVCGVKDSLNRIARINDAISEGCAEEITIDTNVYKKELANAIRDGILDAIRVCCSDALDDEWPEEVDE